MAEKDRPVYIISVAAELVDMHPQTLRLYERKGLVAPRRSTGKTRLYSERDVEKLREIRRLTQELGVNLAGVEEIMRLRDDLYELEHRIQAEVERLKAELGRQLEAFQDVPALPAPGDTSEPRKYVSEKDRPVYVISVASEIVDMHPQTLRLYERKGLVAPRRSSGKTRLYSESDVDKLREIRRLTQELGVNLAGVEEIIRLREQLDGQQSHFEAEISRLKLALVHELTRGAIAEGEPGV